LFARLSLAYYQSSYVTPVIRKPIITPHCPS
jgi:hypothetical protein